MKRSFAVAILGFFLLLSQLILPLLHRADVYPFFSWSMFSSIATPDKRFDLALTFKDGSQCFFSVCERALHVERAELWYLIQKTGLLANLDENVDGFRREILERLASEREILQDVRLVQIRGYFSDFMFSGAAKVVSPERYYDLGVLVSDGK